MQRLHHIRGNLHCHTVNNRLVASGYAPHLGILEICGDDCVQVLNLVPVFLQIIPQLVQMDLLNLYIRFSGNLHGEPVAYILFLIHKNNAFLLALFNLLQDLVHNAPYLVHRKLIINGVFNGCDQFLLQLFFVHGFCLHNGPNMGPGNHQLLLLQPLVCIAHRINADSQLIRQYADGRKLFCPPHLSGKNAPSDIPDQLVRVWDF